MKFVLNKHCYDQEHLKVETIFRKSEVIVNTPGISSKFGNTGVVLEM